MLKTGRLILDSWLPSDWLALRPIAQDPEVMRYITGGMPWSEVEIRRFVDRHVKLYAERGFCRWRLLEAECAEFMCFCGVGFWRDQPEAEIGWWLARPYWGRGLATEAAQCALRDAFERVALDRVISVAMKENAASIRVMEKLGLAWERDFEEDGFRLARYGMTRTEWIQRSDAGTQRRT